MLRFEKSLELTSSSGTPYDFINMACTACNVEMAQTKAMINSLPNGTDTLGIYKDNDMESYRDLLFYIAQVLGCFCQINREGKLQLVPYGNTPVQTIPGTQRFNSSYSDFQTRYTAISSTNLITEQAEYYALEVDDGLTLNLGSNPFMQFGLVTTRERVLRNILDAISVIDYVPFDSSTIGNPALDPGDVLVFSGGQADATKTSCITSITHNIGGKQILKCVGKNPRLASAKSKSDKNITSLLNQVDSNKTVVYNFINASPLSIGSTPVEILNINFTSKEETSAMFLGEVLLEITAADIEATIEGDATYDVNSSPVTTPVSFQFTKKGNPTTSVVYKMNNEEINGFYPARTCHDGFEFLTLFLPIAQVVPNSENSLSVFLKIDGGTIAIGESQIRATISGQGLVAGIGEWDGRINVSELIENVSIPEYDYFHTPFNDTALAILPIHDTRPLQQIISLIEIDELTFGYSPINELVTNYETIKSFTMDFVAPYPDPLEVVVDMDHPSILGIQLMTAEYSGAVGIQYSLDDGTTYSEEVALSVWLNTNLADLWNSLNTEKVLVLHFIVPDGAILSRFKITYIN